MANSYCRMFLTWNCAYVLGILAHSQAKLTTITCILWTFTSIIACKHGFLSIQLCASIDLWLDTDNCHEKYVDCVFEGKFKWQRGPPPWVCHCSRPKKLIWSSQTVLHVRRLYCFLRDIAIERSKFVRCPCTGTKHSSAVCANSYEHGSAVMREKMTTYTLASVLHRY